MHATSTDLCLAEALSTDESFCELSTAFTPCEFRVKWASTAWEQDQAHRLRRAVFCIEQGIIVGDDRDEIDLHAQTIVAISALGGMPDQVVGTVRIHEEAPGVWWGSRLAVHAAFRGHGKLGATLIKLAVSSAHARGCKQFKAHVQTQNVELFERLHWHAHGIESLHGRPHAHMEPELAYYPPCEDPWTGIVTRSSASSRVG
jgi:putative N-acetyltransferase (TIGR04045 family)